MDIKTTLLVSNIHCPSCVSHIKSILADFDDIRQNSIVVSIIDGTVTFTHSQALHMYQANDVLARAGFDVKMDTPKPRPVISLTGMLHDRKRKREHRKVCLACQSSNSSISEKSTLNEKAIDSNVTPSSETITQLQVDGMTCSSCVNTIQGVLGQLPGVQSASVSLLGNSAKISHNASLTSSVLIKAVEDLGYEATLVEDREYKFNGVTVQTNSATPVTAQLSITGMTCASCVTAINAAVHGLPGVQSFSIELTGGSAKAIVTERTQLDKLIETIEDVGYDVELVNVDEAKAATSNRTVKLAIDSMFCERCPEKVIHLMESLHSHVIEATHPTLDAPFISITYTPNAPDFTLRTVFADIAKLGLQARVIHNASLEDRIRRSQHHEQRILLIRLLTSVLFAIPTFIISVVFTGLLKSDDHIRQYFEAPIWGGTSRSVVALFILATPIQLIVGWPFYTASYKSLRGVIRRKNEAWWKRSVRWGSMDLLVALGTSTAYIASLGLMAAEIKAPASSESMTYFDTSIFLIMFIVLGRYLEAVSKQRTGDAVRALGALRPETARVYDEVTQSSEEISVDLLEVNDLILVMANSHPAADCIVQSGSTTFDESPLTGEARPVSKIVGDTIFTGTRNLASPIVGRVTAVGDSNGGTLLDGIIRMVRDAQTRKAPVEKIADTVTGYFVPGIVLTAVLTFVIWVSLAEGGVIPLDWRDTQQGGWPIWALEFAVAVVVVACPCGIGLAAPTAQMVGTGLAAQHGILVQGGGEALQLASSVECIVFDKTGTITTGGEPKVTDEKVEIPEAINLAVAPLYAIIAAIEEGSTHPLALGIRKHCQAKEKTEGDFKLISSEERAGQGIVAQVQVNKGEIQVALGNEALMRAVGCEIVKDTSELVSRWQENAQSVVYVSVSGQVVAVFGLADTIRPEALDCIDSLRRREIDVWLLSGDNPKTAHAVARQVGIPESNVIAGVMPDQKANEIKRLQTKTSADRRIVMMVGDGINDAPALSQADIGVAIGSGSTIAISAAHFILLSSDLGNILTLIELSRVVLRRIKMNFGWAMCYNLVGVPIAAGIIYPAPGHPRLPPVWAALAMALSSVSVVMSSLALRLWRPRK